MTTFYLIRHATNDLVGKAIAGWKPGVHLNAAGVAQADRLSECLAPAGLTHIYSSPLERAQETAAPLAQRSALPVRTSNAIGELNFGDWTGAPLDQLEKDPQWQQWNRFRSGSRIPNGETMLELQTRFVMFIHQLRCELPGKKIALVSHGDPIRAVVLFYLGMPLDLLHRIEVSPASVSILTLSTHAPQFLCVNWCADKPA